MASGVVEAKVPRWGREGEPPSRDASLWRLMRVFWRAMTGLRLLSALSWMRCGGCPIVTWGFTVETGAVSQAGRTWFIKNVADSSSLARKHAMGRPVPPGALFRGAIRDSGAEEGAAGSSCARSRRLPVARALTAGLFAFTVKEAGISLPSCLPWWAARSAITERNETIMVLRGAAFEKCLTGGVSF